MTTHNNMPTYLGGRDKRLRNDDSIIRYLCVSICELRIEFAPLSLNLYPKKEKGLLELAFETRN